MYSCMDYKRLSGATDARLRGEVGDMMGRMKSKYPGWLDEGCLRVRYCSEVMIRVGADDTMG